MSARARLASVLLALVLPGAVVASQLGPRADRSVPGLGTIPARLEPYDGVAEERLGPATLALLRPDDYLQRLYSAPDRPAMWLYVGLYMGGVGSAGAHDPDVCYPAQGWGVIDQRDLTIPLEDGGELAARILEVEREGERRLILYWFQGANRWPGQGLEDAVWRIYDSVRGAPQYAFVRLSAHANYESSPEPELLRFAARLAPHVRAAIGEPDRAARRKGHLRSQSEFRAFFGEKTIR